MSYSSRCLNNVFWRWAVLQLLVLLLLNFPEPAIGADQGANASSASSSASSSLSVEAETVSKTPLVEALEEWYVIEKPKKELKDEIISKLAEEEEENQKAEELRRKVFLEETLLDIDSLEEGEDVKNVVGEKLFIEVEKRRLSKEQRARVSAARRRVARAAIKYRKMLQEKHEQDSRGAPELRICGINLNNYGLREEIKHILRGNEATKVSAKERSVIRVINKSSCDVISLQGIVGRTSASAQQALKRLEQGISKESGVRWQSFLIETGHNLARQGFLVKDGLEVIRTNAFSDRVLPRMEIFDLTKFPRSPTELRIRVPQNQPTKGTTRDVVILSAQVQNEIRTKRMEPEKMKLQVAEGIRQLMELELRQRNDTTIYLLHVDRLSGRNTATTAVLEGRLKLFDFRNEGKCKLNPEASDPESNFVCEEGARGGGFLIGMFGSELPNLPRYRLNPRARGREDVPRYLRLKAPPPLLTPAQRAKQTVELYMLPQDLLYAYQKESKPHVYSVGISSVRNGLPNSPLVWVDLNW